MFITRLIFLILIGSVSSCSLPETVEQVNTEDSHSLDHLEQAEEQYIERYDNGNPKIKGVLVNGEREGLWVSFYENGVRWSEENYRKGLKDGRNISFYPSGHLRFRGQYIDDKKIGLWQFYDEEGKMVKEVQF